MGAKDLERGRKALLAADYAAARDAFRDALQSEESGIALEGLGMACWWLDDIEVVFDSRERAYRVYREQQDARAAARVAIALAEDYLYYRGEPAVAQGWHSRARDMLADVDECVERGWLLFGEGDFALAVNGDPVSASQSAAEARRIGRALKVVDLEMAARALEGAALVQRGEVSTGMTLLDEAAAAAIAGELADPVAVAYSCCYLLVACEKARDFDRAGQWCRRVEALSRKMRFDALFAVCRCQYGSVLAGRGDWQAAEKELLIACDQFARSRPAMQGEALVRLASLKRRQGKLDEVEPMLAELDGHPLALIERAWIALHRGDAALAEQLADRFLRQMPETNRLDRVAALEVTARARSARGDVVGATAVLGELRALAGSNDAIGAAVRMCEGLVDAAAGRHDDARRAFEDSVDAFMRSSAPYDAACARLELARVLGKTPAAEAEARSAHSAFEKLGAKEDAKRAAALFEKKKSDAAGLSAREREVLALIAKGWSNQRIAKQLYVSEFTVKRHVQNILMKLDLPTRTAAAAYAVREGIG